MNEKRIGKISFWKFMFCILIILYHIGSKFQNYNIRFACGSIGVEFFFLVSGYFLAKKCANYKPKKSLGEETFDFMKNKIKKFLPYIILLIIIVLPYLAFVKHYTLIEYVTNIYRVLLIPTTFSTDTALFDALWFLTAMIVVETFMFPLIVKYKKNFIYMISPIIVILLMNYILIETKILVSPWTETPIALKGILRGFLVINIGMYIYLLSEKFNNIKLTKLSKILLAIIEIFLYLSVFYITNIPHAHIQFDVFMLMLLSLGLLISLNPNVYLTKFFNKETFYFLEKLSLPMYMYQWIIIYIIEAIFKALEINITYWIFVLFTIPILIFMSVLVLNLVKLYKKK